MEKSYLITIKDKEINFKDIDDLSIKLEDEIYKPKICEAGIIKSYEKDIILNAVSEIMQKEPENNSFEYKGLKVNVKDAEINLANNPVMAEVNRVLDIYALKTREMSKGLKEKNKFYAVKLSEKISLLEDKYGIDAGEDLANLDEKSLEAILSNIINEKNLENEKISLNSIKDAIKKEFEETFNIIPNEYNMMFQNLGLNIGFLVDPKNADKIGRVELTKRVSTLREILDNIYEKMPWMRKEIMNYKIKNE